MQPIAAGVLAAAGFAGASLLVIVLVVCIVRNTRLTAYLEAERGLRRAAEERERLLGEEYRKALGLAAHRIDNSLQLVSSLVNLQRNSTLDEKDRGHVDGLANRIRALLLAYSTDDGHCVEERIGARGYLENLIQHLRGEHLTVGATIRLSSRIDDTVLDRQTAFGFGLIVNELVSNAIVHAFDGGADGTVAVALAGSAESLVLTVSDDGKGIPEKVLTDARMGLGLNLVKEMGSQMGASVVCETGKGTVFTVRLARTEPERSESGDRG